MEPELNRMVPEGVTVYTTRITSSGSNAIERLLNYDSALEPAAKALAPISDVIIYGCTTGSLVKGIGWDQEIIQRIEKETGIAASTTSTAVVDALTEIGVKRVSVATPYVEALNIRVKQFLEGHGFEVVSLKGLGQVAGVEGIGKNTPEVGYRLSKEVYTPKADAIFISCTNLRTIEIISKLENDINKPVITSNQASMWKALKMINVLEPIQGYGLLLSRRSQ
jgi:maleate isomerase